MKVLVIEDNPRLAIRVKEQLSKWFIVETANSGERGLQLLTSGSFQIVLLDLGLPDAPGADICKQIRNISQAIPILVVTGIDTIESRVDLLEIGADDYITKPFNIDELRARINALLRRQLRSESLTTLIIDDLVIEPARRLVTRAGKNITLRRKEFDILEYLARNPGRVMSRQNIINHAWPSTTTSWPGSVDVHIKQLRDKIDKPFATHLIKTSYGLGYMLNVADTPVKQKTH